ncbi:MAG: hypothetical protein OXR68_02500 [Alphaproteobacteria bacterium]|nr:hypothetical protein [Alphaproteobacteria bacterium]MDD9919479.1 hypothetical protein [Alphaproteobacteria bacterium]
MVSQSLKSSLLHNFVEGYSNLSSSEIAEKTQLPLPLVWVAYACHQHKSCKGETFGYNYIQVLVRTAEGKKNLTPVYFQLMLKLFGHKVSMVENANINLAEEALKSVVTTGVIPRERFVDLAKIFPEALIAELFDKNISVEERQKIVLIFVLKSILVLAAESEKTPFTIDDDKTALKAMEVLLGLAIGMNGQNVSLLTILDDTIKFISESE